jgi:hypothetical protein
MYGTHISRVQNFTMNEKNSPYLYIFHVFIISKYYNPMKKQDLHNYYCQIVTHEICDFICLLKTQL